MAVRYPLSEVLHPASLVALAILLLNDWVLKGRGPAWLTGKLSDFAGVFLFPLVLTATFDCVRYAVHRAAGRPFDKGLRPGLLAAAIALVAAGFATLQLSPAVAALVPVTTPDPTDLAALAMLPLTWMVGRRARP